ncbi:MAG: acyl-CoA thioesterase [Deltaproteobacteria bacterium]|nr:acyl-CoA thioesterase [Deltaproteobacteria bacterium]MBN2671516.1 acyl-CoA thioesterase [Deltaproteobacteria bacterium]
MTEMNGFGPENYSILKYRVLYADTDKMGIVYHSNYFRWFEAARGSYMRRRELPYTITEAGGTQIPLTEAGIRYFKPALYEQLVDIKVWVSDITAVQVKFAYEVFFEGELLIRGFTNHAAINVGTMRPTRVPKQFEDALNRRETLCGDPYL